MKTSRAAVNKSTFIREIRNLIPFVLIFAVLLAGTAFAQQKPSLGDNAALRYYAAFAQMQDYGITDAEVKKLNGILDGPVPYDDSQYKDLVEKNKPALETMARGAALPKCDWGLDYIGEDTPVDYARSALALGRLNVLYAFHLLIAGDKDGAVSAIKAGLRFSQDVANGGSLFATLAAKSLLVTHLRAIAFVLHTEELSAPQRSALQKAVARLGPDSLDWPSAAKRDLESLRGRYSNDPQASAALTKTISLYVAGLNAPKTPTVAALHDLPPQLADLIPNPKRVWEEKQDLSNQLAQTRALLQ
ncbi:MAG: hypothetical protein WBQ08_04955 [Candidatus Sulfotelmatobacter sp.]